MKIFKELNSEMIGNRETNISMMNLDKNKIEMKVRNKIIWMIMMR